MDLKPIIPFEPINSNEIPTGDDFISQIKWDGVRILTYFDGTNTRLFNRKLNERTMQFPELTNVQTFCHASSVILDGEVIALDKNGNNSFHEVMRRDSIRRIVRVKSAALITPVYYMIFDVVYYNNEWVNNWLLKDRIELLNDIIRPNNNVQLVPKQKDGNTLFEVVKKHNMEGIIVKGLNSRYVINGKNSSWRKIKNYKDLIAVVGGVTFRLGTVNSLLLGLYDNNEQLWYVGNAGSGKLTSLDWENITKLVSDKITTESPFINIPKGAQKTLWVKPNVTVKIKYIEWPEGHSIRQPTIEAFVDHPPSECKLEQRNS
ncbi:RNA ligase family protein [Schinkia azotoformans]|uniref:ATP-dependent DNA ligase n=1 Tax=Schinkia azotoformans TaxID=1454 RepID=UPI002E2145CC|nr:RNA ligase family protein [Schinkia azotoformans]